MVQAATSDYGTMASQAVEFLGDSSTGQQMLTEIRLHLALPTPMPQSLDPSYFVAPTQPASAQQLCSDGPVYIESAPAAPASNMTSRTVSSQGPNQVP